MRTFLFALLLSLAGTSAALDKAAVEKLAFGESEERTAALAALVAEADPRAVPLLQRRHQFGDPEAEIARCT